jgi:hypothetical protein
MGWSHRAHLGGVRTTRAMHGPRNTPAKAARRCSRLAQWSAPAVLSANNVEGRASLAAKVGNVLGAHLLGLVDADVPNTGGTAAALGRVQTGEVEQEILANMGLRHLYDMLWRRAWEAHGGGSRRD